MDDDSLRKKLAGLTYDQSTMDRIVTVVGRAAPLTERTWESARAALSGKQLEIASDPNGDAGDTEYSIRLDREALNAVVAGMAYRRMENGEGLFIKGIRHEDKDNFRLIVSEAVARQLNTLVRSLDMESPAISAGRAT